MISCANLNTVGSFAPKSLEVSRNLVLLLWFQSYIPLVMCI